MSREYQVTEKMARPHPVRTVADFDHEQHAKLFVAMMSAIFEWREYRVIHVPRQPLPPLPFVPAEAVSDVLADQSPA